MHQIKKAFRICNVFSRVIFFLQESVPIFHIKYGKKSNLLSEFGQEPLG